MPPLALLEKVDLRTIWNSEAQDFTPWLAQEQNLNLLGKAVSLDLELEASEQNVGSFRADLLCKELNSEGWVLIENQLEESDHTHLGQLLTYAAGLDARVVIWIAKRFTQEHRAALDRLNTMMGSDGMHFFAIEVELWKIGHSSPAPKFNVVVQPNDWSNQVLEASRAIETRTLSDTKKLQLEYWTHFKDNFKERKAIRIRKPQAKSWATFPIGRTGMWLAASVNLRERWIAAELYLQSTEAKEYFQILLKQKESIESEIGTPLEWNELPDKVASRILLRLNNADSSNKDDWFRQQTWIANSLDTLRNVFSHRVKELKLEECAG